MKVIKVNIEDLEKAKEVLESNGIGVEVIEDYYLILEDNVSDILSTMEGLDLSDTECDGVIKKITDLLYYGEYSVLDLEYIVDKINKTLEDIKDSEGRSEVL